MYLRLKGTKEVKCHDSHVLDAHTFPVIEEESGM